MTTIAVAQTAPRFLDPRANLDAALAQIDSVEADLYLFPELFLSGYTFSTREQVESTAISTDDPFFETILAVSRERSIAVCGGYPEVSGDDLFNSAFFIGDGKFLSNYRKTHLFFREGQFFTPGDTGFSTVEYHGAQFGIMICFDWMFPEAARTLAILGAEVILHPANLVMPYCQRAMFARAVENRVFIATSNRVGHETNSYGDDLVFTGGSQVVSPVGEYVLTFTETEMGIQTVDIDPAIAREKSLNQFNTILKDRRPKMYRQ